MKMTSNETSFALLKSIITENVDEYVHLIIYIYNCGRHLKKTVNSSSCAAAIELSENNGSSNQITEELVRDFLKNLFKPLTSRICEEKGRTKDQERYL